MKFIYISYDSYAYIASGNFMQYFLVCLCFDYDKSHEVKYGNFHLRGHVGV
jgi:hypothetical protein